MAPELRANLLGEGPGDRAVGDRFDSTVGRPAADVLGELAAR